MIGVDERQQVAWRVDRALVNRAHAVLVARHIVHAAGDEHHRRADTLETFRIPETALLRGQQAGPISLRDGNLLGRLFESFVLQSIRVYAQAAQASVYYLRSSSGDREVDIIVERDDGRVIAIEVKLTPNIHEDDVKHLLWLRREIGEELLDAVVVTPGQFAYRRKADGIAVVPAAMLGP